MSKTALFWDERCFWHAGGGYAFTAPIGGFTQPFASGGLPDDPETKRRLTNLLSATGLGKELQMLSAPLASQNDLLRVHPERYLGAFKELSDAGGGEIAPGSRAPFGAGGYETAALSAGLTKAALLSVLNGDHKNAYALSRPPGHHCLPDKPNGFCLLANIAIAIESAISLGHNLRFAVVDWDVHHGNGTEAIYYDAPDVLTISIHQERNYPWDTGEIEAVGQGGGTGTNMNIPLPPGAGHKTYIEAMNRLILPKLATFKPDVVIVACGFDASGVDPLGRMLAGSHTFAHMTRSLMDFTEKHCAGKLVMSHEGGYSELHVPFCGHAVLQTMSGSSISAPDPLADRLAAQQPNDEMEQVFSFIIDRYVEHFDLQPVAKT